MSGGLLVAGTTSDAGKSVVTAGICRWLARQGVKVAPFKAQNMSLNSYVTRAGEEIGRAQAMQAAAARVEPEGAMNPVLLKPGATHTQVMLLDEPVADADAMSYEDLKPRLRETVLGCLADLRTRFDAVVCEGAGSPAEINLRRNDLVNMGLARRADLPVVLVGDIDRGGVFAGMYGSLALLDEDDQRLLAGFVVNKFRGDVRLLEPGLDMLYRLTGRQVLGVLPWQHGLWVDAEDSLELARERGVELAPPAGDDVLRVAVVRYPYISNFTDVDPLIAEPGVAVRFVTRPEDMHDADLVVLPGTRATVSDLHWLRGQGLDRALARRVAEGQPVLGVCGGYQMLCGEIHDDVESRQGVVRGLGLLPATTRFGTRKVLDRPTGSAFDQPVEGYAIHHGVVKAFGGEEFLGGCAVGTVRGTTWHGILECDGFRRALLSRVADETGRRFVPSGDVRFAEVRERRLDALGDLVEEHLDTDALRRLVDEGAPTDLPFVPPGAP